MKDQKTFEYDFKVATASSIICATTPNNQQAASQIFQKRLSLGHFKCKCRSAQFILSADGRQAQCNICKMIVMTTKDTVMEYSTQLLAWIAAIRLMEQGLAISAHRLSRMFLITPSCADSIIKKILIVIASEMPEEALLVSAQRFKKIISRRSANTPASMHAYEEQTLIEREHELVQPDSAQHIDSELSELSEKQKNILEHLSKTPVSVDALYQKLSMPFGEFYSNLTMLELGNFAKQKDDGKIVRIDESAQSSLKENLHGASEETIQNQIEQIVEFAHGIFHSVSRKYLQLFIAAYWCHTDRKKWCKDALFTACLKHPPISPAQMAAYSSPPLIKIMPFNPD